MIKISKSSKGTILYCIAWIILIVPTIYNYKINKEEMSRKQKFVDTHTCKIIEQEHKLTFYDWRSNSIQITKQDTRYKCDGVDGIITVRL